MRAGPLVLLAFVQCTSVIAADGGRPTGANCQLGAPPETAGELLSRGITLRVYPRARDIGSDYTGCQLVWVPHEGQWALLSAVEIAGGDPVRVWSPDDADPEIMSCRYKNGRVVSGKANCPHPRVLIKKSLAPGCVARAAAGCKYE